MLNFGRAVASPQLALQPLSPPLFIGESTTLTMFPLFAQFQSSAPCLLPTAFYVQRPVTSLLISYYLSSYNAYY